MQRNRNMTTSAKSYNKLMNDCLTPTYKVADGNIVDKIKNKFK